MEGRTGSIQDAPYKDYLQKAKRNNYVWKMFRGFLIIGLSFVILHPLMIKISQSMMSESELFDITVQWIPRSISLENYVRAFIFMDYPETVLRTFAFASAMSVLTLLSCTLIGYGLARFDFAYRNILFGLVLFTLVVPPQLLLVPMFINFRFFNLFGLLDPGFDLIDSYWPFILTSITGTGINSGLFIFVARQYFKGMPKGLEEAARIDGAGAVKVFTTIMLPGAVPVLIIIFLFSFVWHWNDSFYINLFTPRGEQLAHALTDLAGRYESHHINQYGEELSPQYISALNNTGMLLFLAPVIIVYCFVQRYFIESVERTGIVG